MRVRDAAGATITPYSMESIGKALAAEAEAAANSQSWVGNNRAIYVPFILARDATVKKLFWHNGSTVVGTENVCVAIYDDTQVRLITTGSTLQSGASAIQEVDVADTSIPAGRNWLAMSCSSSSCTFLGRNPGSTFLRWQGCYIQGASVPLPATATMATPSNNALIAVFGALLGPVP